MSELNESVLPGSSATANSNNESGNQHHVGGGSGVVKTNNNSEPNHHKNGPNIFIRFVRAVFGYRKTTLTLFVVLTIAFTVLLSFVDNNLDLTVSLPTNQAEIDILDASWLDLQNIAKHEHTYGSHANDKVHDYLETRILDLIKQKNYIEYENDLNGDNKILFQSGLGEQSTVSYYESNNLLVRINGTDKNLPALLLSAHYDSVPSSFGVTDDGMGIASLLGVLSYFSSKSSQQPLRTLIFNFNNNEEFGLYGATSFLSHPWFKQVKYFLNLEGTGAGGKAMLFRGTDYGIVKYFKNVRYPYATSIFQEGFNNHLIHSETDYKVYKEMGGLRGLDLAFYKPRDIYHTAGDNIKNNNIKSLWHMLSNSIDFTNYITGQVVDLDNESVDESEKSSQDYASYASFLNYFFAIPVSTLIVVNTCSLVLIPLFSIPLLLVIFKYKQTWQVTAVNILKFPVAVLGSGIVLNILVSGGFQKLNQYLPTTYTMLLVYTSVAVLMLLFYTFLNGINLLFRSHKVLNHDEKLIVIMEISFFYWVALIFITKNLSQNRIGNDHTGEFPISLLFIVQSVASFFGLLGWSFKNPQSLSSDDEASHPLLVHNHETYGAEESDTPQSSLSDVDGGETGFKELVKYVGYDWSVQFLVIVPLTSLIVYNSGWLVLDGVNKSIQESLAAENFIYKLVQIFAFFWVLPFLPFVFKLNRILVVGLTLFAASGVVLISFLEPFNPENPLKLRFIQKVDLTKSVSDSFVQIYGREGIFSDILADIPSVKESQVNITCENIADGNQICSYKSVLPPQIIPDATDFHDYLKVEIVENSTVNSKLPYGLLYGEIIIKAPDNRMCNLQFDKKTSHSGRKEFKDSPAKTVIIFADKPKNESAISQFDAVTVPEGFSRDADGNYLFKDVSGIDNVFLNKLDWKKNFHIGIQWLPNIIDSPDDEINQLGISIECFWADMTPINGGNSAIPAYRELLHYSPNHVSWANRDRGLFSVFTRVEV
ncbi:Vacuolar membrane protease [Spathaspora sp. JA1]|nr:Vacuolar membrane protease [Spathaspora sp. JA1]